MIDEKWISEAGSIFTEATHFGGVEIRGKDGNISKLKCRKAVAFNVGVEVANHIVTLHNAQLALELQPVPQPLLQVMLNQCKSLIQGFAKKLTELKRG